MRLALLILILALSLRAEFLRIEVAFEDIGCASCLESLEGRLKRVRGVEQADIDPAKGLAKLRLTRGNRVRLTLLLGRITQDGTKVLRTHVEARGTITISQPEFLFQPADLSQSYRLKLPAQIKRSFEAGVIYRIAGTVPQSGPSGEPVIEAESVLAEAEARN